MNADAPNSNRASADGQLSAARVHMESGRSMLGWSTCGIERSSPGALQRIATAIEGVEQAIACHDQQIAGTDTSDILQRVEAVRARIGLLEATHLLGRRRAEDIPDFTSLVDAADEFDAAVFAATVENIPGLTWPILTLRAGSDGSRR